MNKDTAKVRQRVTGTHLGVKSTTANYRWRREQTAKDATTELSGSCLAKQLMASGALTHGHGAASNSGCNFK